MNFFLFSGSHAGLCWAATRTALLMALLCFATSDALAALHGRDLGGTPAFDAYYDDELNITWLADAQSGAGLRSWGDAQSYVSNLNAFGLEGWRLPHVLPINGVAFYVDPLFAPWDGTSEQGGNITSLGSELSHLFYITLGNRGYFDPLGNMQPNYGLTNSDPFANFNNNVGGSNTAYSTWWSGTEYQPSLSFVFIVGTGAQGVISNGPGDSWGYAWAVRDGDVLTSVPEVSTALMLILGLLMIGVATHQRRRTCDANAVWKAG